MDVIIESIRFYSNEFIQKNIVRFTPDAIFFLFLFTLKNWRNNWTTEQFSNVSFMCRRRSYGTEMQRKNITCINHDFRVFTSCRSSSSSRDADRMQNRSSYVSPLHACVVRSKIYLCKSNDELATRRRVHNCLDIAKESV